MTCQMSISDFPYCDERNNHNRRRQPDAVLSNYLMSEYEMGKRRNRAHCARPLLRRSCRRQIMRMIRAGRVKVKHTFAQ